MSFDVYAESTQHHVSKHNFTLRTNQFIDVGYKKCGDFTIFSKSSHVFYKNSFIRTNALIFGKKCLEKAKNKVKLAVPQNIKTKSLG